MSFCPGTPKLGNPEILEIGILTTLEVHNFLLRPLIELMSQEKL
jgi:hypothetical protein